MNMAFVVVENNFRIDLITKRRIPLKNFSIFKKIPLAIVLKTILWFHSIILKTNHLLSIFLNIILMKTFLNIMLSKIWNFSFAFWTTFTFGEKTLLLPTFLFTFSNHFEKISLKYEFLMFVNISFQDFCEFLYFKNFVFCFSFCFFQNALFRAFFLEISCF